MHFGPSFASRHGMVLADLSGMVAKPARTPGETRTQVMELDRRVKVAEDVTGEPISENHSKSILVGILAPLMRQHTAISRAEDAMQVGRER